MPTAEERRQLNERLTDSELRPRLNPETEQRRRDRLDRMIQKVTDNEPLDSDEDE